MSLTGQAPLTAKVKPGSSLVWVLVWAAIAATAGAGIRYGMIELDFFRNACQADVLPWWCWPRQILLAAFDLWILGGISVVCALYGLVKPEPTRAALIAVIFGALGVALYNAGPASIGFVFGLATVARHRP